MVKNFVSVIVPAYNEEGILGESIRRLERLFKESLGNFEIIISEDGSSDGTREVAMDLESDTVRAFHSDRRLGKGAAIRNAAKAAKGNFIIFMDADLASNPSHVGELVRHLEGGAAMVIGSRYMKESDSRRSIIRYVASRSFNWLVRAALGSRLSDHQCGFKAFRKDLVLPLINEVEEEGWFWDTELLVRAQRRGLAIAEIPIEWREAPGSKFNLFRDSWRMARSLVSFKLKNG